MRSAKLLFVLLLSIPALAEAQRSAAVESWDIYEDIVVKYSRHKILACHIDLYERSDGDSLQFVERETSIYRSAEDSAVCVVDPHFDRSVCYQYNRKGELMMHSLRKIGYHDSTVAHYYTLASSSELLTVRRQKGDTLGSCLYYEDSIYYDSAGNEIRHYYNRGHGCLGGLVRTFTYDHRNRMVSKTDHADEYSVCYEYDSLGRLHREWTGYHFNGKNPREMIDLTSYLFHYDSLGQLVTEIVTGHEEERVYRYTYDALGRLRSKRAFSHVEEPIWREEWDYHPTDDSYRYLEYRRGRLHRIVYYTPHTTLSRIEHYLDDRVIRAWQFHYVDAGSSE